MDEIKKTWLAWLAAHRWLVYGLLVSMQVLWAAQLHPRFVVPRERNLSHITYVVMEAPVLPMTAVGDAFMYMHSLPGQEVWSYLTMNWTYCSRCATATICYGLLALPLPWLFKCAGRQPFSWRALRPPAIAQGVVLALCALFVWYVEFVVVWERLGRMGGEG